MLALLPLPEPVDPDPPEVAEPLPVVPEPLPVVPDPLPVLPIVALLPESRKQPVTVMF